MRLEPPSWWYGPPAHPLAVVLSPLGRVYGFAADSHFRITQPYRSRIPVLCIGNFTVGGAGKTPTALALQRMLLSEGLNPGFLTRGYGGAERGPYRVNAAIDSASATGDEALLLAKRALTVVSRDRAAGARFLEACGCGCIIMDDGFQNPSLAKTFSLVVVDGEAGLGNGRVFPAGPLRAPLRNQLARADAVLVVGGEAKSIHPQISASGIPVLRGRLAIPAQAKTICGQTFAAYCGIGRPAKFFDTLKAAGATLAAVFSFPDHHVFREADAEMLLESAGAANARLITTEKDHARLAGANGVLAQLRDRSLVLPVEMQFSDEGENRLRALLASRLSRL